MLNYYEYFLRENNLNILHEQERVTFHRGGILKANNIMTEIFLNLHIVIPLFNFT